jgi:hypothetical protein
MKKKLDTLVQDIYDTVAVLNDGESLNIPEEDIQEFGTAMMDALRSWSTPRDRSDQHTLRMSNVGRPLRQLWYDIRSDDEVPPISSPNFIKFFFGHMAEPFMFLLIKLAGHTIIDEQKEVKVSGVTGHMDCIIDGEVVDIKTASSFAFRKFKNGTLREDDPFGYLAQLAGYEESEGTTQGGFLAINKENGELAMYCPEELDKPNIKIKIRNIKKALKLDSPPNRCYTSISDGKSGNMKLPTGCVYCRHKNTCHQDANEGNGLRVFKYSNKLVYFTKVAKEPRVQEITYD